MSAQAQQERRREKSARVKRAILDATEALLSEGGLEAFSMRRLVERCEYTAPTIYHHFGDKEGLLDALLSERFEQFARRMRRERHEDPVEQLRAVAKSFVRFGVRYPNHYQLLFSPRAPDHAPPAVVDEMRVQLDQVWTDLWEAGRIRAGDREAAAQSLWTLCNGLISGRILRPDVPWSKTVNSDAIDALLLGLIAPSASKPSSRSPRRKKES